MMTNFPTSQTALSFEKMYGRLTSRRIDLLFIVIRRHLRAAFTTGGAVMRFVWEKCASALVSLYRMLHRSNARFAVAYCGVCDLSVRSCFAMRSSRPRAMSNDFRRMSDERRDSNIIPGRGRSSVDFLQLVEVPDITQKFSS